MIIHAVEYTKEGRTGVIRLLIPQSDLALENNISPYAYVKGHWRQVYAAGVPAAAFFDGNRIVVDKALRDIVSKYGPEWRASVQEIEAPVSDMTAMRMGKLPVESLAELGW